MTNHKSLLGYRSADRYVGISYLMWTKSNWMSMSAKSTLPERRTAEIDFFTFLNRFGFLDCLIG